MVQRGRLPRRRGDRYDCRHRLVQVKVYNWVGPGPDDWATTPAVVRRLLWWEGLVLMELDSGTGVPPVDTALRRYTWGLDLGSQGAGPVNSRAGLWPAAGVGGLLALMELDCGTGVPPVDTVLRRYTWGLDLASQSAGPVNSWASLWPAAGVGGLLALEDLDAGTGPSGGFLCQYDGNGNVGQVVDADDGSIAVQYEYAPYGARINAPAAGELEQPFRFSTRWYDGVTGLYQFPRRAYDPAMGRWLSRDPIEEDGGANLYGYAGNRPADSLDPRGLMWILGSLLRAGTVCCEYEFEKVYTPKALGARQFEVYSSFERCRKTQSCITTWSSFDPETCCKCSNAGSKRKLVGAEWGPCCWCTLTVRTEPIHELFTDWGGWHHVLLLECPGLRRMIDLNPSYVRNLGDDRGTRARGQMNAALEAAHRKGSTKRIACKKAEALMAEWDRLFPPGELTTHPYEKSPTGMQCRTFALKWYYEAGDVSECD
jgi:RHS repeat-associated protein